MITYMDISYEKIIYPFITYMEISCALDTASVPFRGDIGRALVIQRAHRSKGHGQATCHPSSAKIKGTLSGHLSFIKHQYHRALGRPLDTHPMAWLHRPCHLSSMRAISEGPRCANCHPSRAQIQGP